MSATRFNNNSQSDYSSQDELVCEFKLYSLLREGLDDIEVGSTRLFEDAIKDIQRRR